MIDLKKYEVWFLTGSQHLYGEAALKQVAANSEEVVRTLNASSSNPVQLVFKSVVTTPEEISKVCEEANYAEKCVGLVVWMHTFSPAKMWINGLTALRKPFAHLHTQFNTEIPWSTIDMDFMNLNQAAHGDREFGFMVSRMRRNRKVIVGHWKSSLVHEQLGRWSRVACAWHEMQRTRIARIGDNMRQVAVTEGDKVEAQMKFGFSVNAYGVGDVVAHVNAVSNKAVDDLVKEYEEIYVMDKTAKGSEAVREAARIELGLRSFLTEGGFHGFTDTFENLHGLKQLPGIAAQRLMNDGYGFGAEGDWKTAALLRAMKIMDSGLKGGTSFMEDYTYDFRKDGTRVLGSHMLEICPSIASGKPVCAVHPLSIGGKADPARLIFNVDPGPAINVSLIDMGNRFRLLVNDVDAVKVEEMPKLPVARVLWNAHPSFEVAATSWILAGGAHHTVFSKAITTAYIEDLADMAGVELAVIDKNTTIREFRDSLRWNEVYYNHYAS